MKIDERFLSFLSSFPEEPDVILDALEREALDANVPIIRKDTKRLLRVLLAAKRPETLLEIGTGVGVSALVFARYGTELKELLTIENYPPRIEAARQNFERAEGLVPTLLAGDAKALLPTLPDGHFDFLFLDAAKGQYKSLLPELFRVSKDGALLVTDNVLQEGTVLDSRFAVERRDRTIHTRMREFLAEIMQGPDWTTTILPVGDGVAISVCKKETA